MVKISAINQAALGKVFYEAARDSGLVKGGLDNFVADEHGYWPDDYTFVAYQALLETLRARRLEESEEIERGFYEETGWDPQDTAQALVDARILIDESDLSNPEKTVTLMAQEDPSLMDYYGKVKALFTQIADTIEVSGPEPHLNKT